MMLVMWKDLIVSQLVALTAQQVSVSEAAVVAASNLPPPPAPSVAAAAAAAAAAPAVPAAATAAPTTAVVWRRVAARVAVAVANVMDANNPPAEEVS
jgi:hypothetical protein